MTLFRLPNTTASEDSGMRKCETFGCPNEGATMYSLSTGTTVWLCTLCIDVAEWKEELPELGVPEDFQASIWARRDFQKYSLLSKCQKPW